MHRCFPEATSVGNGPDEKQHLIPASTSVLLSLVRDWNPGALAAVWNICIHTHLSQLGSRAEKTALSRGLRNISVIQIQGWVPWGRGRHSAKSSQEEALVGGREGEERSRLQSVFGSCSISFCPLP